MKRTASIVGLFFLPFFCGSFMIQTAEDRFWNWFVKNQEILYSDEVRFISDPDLKVFQELEDRLDDIDVNLKFSIGEKDKNRVKEFIISAQGVRSLFPNVIEIIDKAPKLKKWKFTAFSQRVPMAFLTKTNYPKTPQKKLVVNGENKYDMPDAQYGFEDLFFKYSNTSRQLDLELYIRDWDQNRKGYMKMISKRLLTDLLGEYDLENEIDWINYIKLDKNNMEGLYPIVRLRELIDKRKSNRKVPLNTFRN